MNDKPAYKLSSNLASMLLGGCLIVFGILSLFGHLVGDFFHFDIGHFAWPVFIIIAGGLTFLAGCAFDRKPGVAIAIIGGIVAASGLILFVQNTFDLYATWAYSWALVAPTSIGLAKAAYGVLRGVGDEVKSGLQLAGIGFGLFVCGAFFFELVIGISGFAFGHTRYLWPSLLIGLGLVILVTNLLPRRSATAAK